MRENRRLARKAPNQNFELRELRSGEIIGQLANITTEGLMLIGPSEITPGSLLQLSMALPEPIDGTDRIEFGVESLWTQPTGSGGRYWTGFQIIDIAPSHSAVIETLTADWKQS